MEAFRTIIRKMKAALKRVGDTALDILSFL